jgi:hypothetical protein
MTDEPLKTEPETPEEPITEEPTTEAGGEQAKAPGADDFRDALSNLSAALDRFGRATEARARQEWREGKPEIQRAVDEMKRGVEGLVRKSGEAFDSISKRLNRDDPNAKWAEDSPTQPAEPEAKATSDNGTTPSNEQP